MNLSDIGRAPALRAPTLSPKTPRAPEPAEQRWPDLVARIGAEIAGPLTAALERINTLTSTGKIDRAGLRALRDEVDAARQAGLVGQQLTRFASGRIRPTPERVALTEVLAGVVAHRTREAAAQGVTLQVTNAVPVEVRVDAPLLFSLLNAVLDGAIAGAVGPIELALENPSWPTTARLVCGFAPRPADDSAGHRLPGASDSLTWRLVQEIARVLGIAVDRREEADRSTLTLEFPRVVALHSVDHAVEGDDGFAPSNNSQPLAGSHVLVIASRRDLRAQIRDALRHMSLIVDFVSSIEEAVGFCREGLPHAVIVESIQLGERFSALRAEVSREVPDFVFIEILEEGRAFEMSDFSGTRMARVGREALASSLPAALIFELSQGS